MKSKIITILTFLALWQTFSYAIDSDSFSFNGYGEITHYYADSEHNDYLMFGLQLNGQLTEDLTFTLQESASKRTHINIDKDIFALELAHFGYHFNDTVEARLGRMLIPTFMFSDILNVSYYYDITSTQNVYAVTPIKHFNGVELRHNIDFYDQDISSTLFYGKTKSDIYSMSSDGRLSISDSDYGDVYGLVLRYEYENFSARSAYVESYVSADKDLNIQKDDFYYVNLGMRYDFEQAYILGEYVKLDAKETLPETSAWYIVAGYNLGKWIPFVSYSSLKSIPKPLPPMPQGNVPPEGIPQGNVPPEGMPQGSFPPEGMPQGNVPPEGMPQGNVPPEGMPQESISSDKFSLSTTRSTTKSIGLRYNIYENMSIKFQYSLRDDDSVMNAAISFVF